MGQLDMTDENIAPIERFVPMFEDMSTQQIDEFIKAIDDNIMDAAPQTKRIFEMIFINTA